MYKSVFSFLRLVAIFLIVLSCSDSSTRDTNSKGDQGKESGQKAQVSSFTLDTQITSENLDLLFSAKSILRDVAGVLEIGFNGPVVTREHVGKEINSNTRIEIDPPVSGEWTWSTNRKLIFSPDDNFAYGTTYNVKVKQLSTKDGVVQANDDAKWESAFVSPRFKVDNLELVEIDKYYSTIKVQVSFTGPVDKRTLKENIELSMNGRSLGNSFNVKLHKPNEALITLSDNFRNSKKVNVRLKGALKSVDNVSLGEDYNGQFEVKVKGFLRVADMQVYEGDNGRYIQVRCEQKLDASRYWSSWNTRLDAEQVKRFVEISPATNFSISAYRGGFKIYGDFSKGSYEVKINPGIVSSQGALLTDGREQQIYMPARKPSVKFLSKGRYLPKNYIKSLPVSHVNLPNIKVTIRQIYEQNVNFWLGNSNEVANDQISDLVETRNFEIKNVEDQNFTSWLNLEGMLPKDRKGVFEIKVSGNGSSSSDYVRLILTDIAMVVKQNKRDIDVWTLDVNTLEPIGGSEVVVFSKSNMELASKSTNSDGFCTFKDLVSSKNRNNAFSLRARNGDDLTAFMFSDLIIDQSAYDVNGMPYELEQSYIASIYSNSGVYRPGQTARITVIVRDSAVSAPKSSLPLIGKVLDPQRKPFLSLKQSSNEVGMANFDIPFQSFANTGKYEFVLETGGHKLASYQFNVEEFVPERMKVKLATPKKKYTQSEQVGLDINADYLFGAPAANQKVEVALTIREGVFKPKSNQDYTYSVWRAEDVPPISLETITGKLDKAGKLTLDAPAISLITNWRGSATLNAMASVFESGSGRTTTNDINIPIHPADYYIGLKSSSKKMSYDKPVEIQGIVVDLDGNKMTEEMPVELSIYQIQSEWVWEYDKKLFRERYHRYVRENLHRSETINTKDGKFSYTLKQEEYNEGFIVKAKIGENVETSILIEGQRWYYYYYSERDYGNDLTPKKVQPENIRMDVPERISTDEEFEVTVYPPYAGKMLLNIEADKVVASKWIDVTEEPITVSLELDDFYPNVYVSALVLKNATSATGKSFMPGSAYAVKSIAVEPEPFMMDLAIDAPEETVSNQAIDVTLDIGSQSEISYATVSIVDEGILQLTKFKSPDPKDQLFTKRKLGVKTFETMGWTLRIPPVTSQSPAGDGSGESQNRIMPIKPVVLWSGIVEIPKSGKKKLTFDIPQYQGKLRVMAVSATKKKTGNSEAFITVKDPIILTSTFPRFLHTKDRFEVPVSLINMTGSRGTFDVNLKTGKTASLKSADKSITLEPGATGILRFEGVVNETLGGLYFDVNVAGNGFKARNDQAIPIIPNAPIIQERQFVKLQRGKNDLSALISDNWFPAYEKDLVMVTGNNYIEELSHLKYLIRYPYGCIEQTTSTTRPLLYIGSLLVNYEDENGQLYDIDNKFMSGINRLFSMQISEGGFSYWPGQTAPTYWGTAYATHVMLLGTKKGYPINQEKVNDALKFMERSLNGNLNYTDAKYGYSVAKSEPYMHYVLALAGKGRKARIKKLIENPNRREWDELTDENLYLLKAALYLTGDRTYEEDLKRPNYQTTFRRTNGWSFWSTLRTRGMMLDIMEDLFPGSSDGEILAEKISSQLKNKSSRSFTTQELSWTVSALGKRSVGAAKNAQYSLSYNGKTVDPEDSGGKGLGKTWKLYGASKANELSVDVTNMDGDLFAFLDVEGMKVNESYIEKDQGISIRREYVSQTGYPIDLEDVTLGDLVFVELTLKNNTSEKVQNIAVTDRLPGGFEIENPRLSRDFNANWIDRNKSWDVDYMNIRDHSIDFFGHLSGNSTKKMYYVVRAVTKGYFHLPPVKAEAMYDPDVNSLNGGGMVRILE